MADPEVIFLLEQIRDNVTGGGGGGSTMNQTTVFNDYTASDLDSVWVDASSNSVIVTLPAPSQDVRVRVIAVDIGGGNAVEVAPNGSEDISGSAGAESMTERESLDFECDGSDWWIT